MPINELATRCQKLTIFAEVIEVFEEDDISNLYVFSNNVNFVNLGSISCSFINKFRIIRKVQKCVKSYVSKNHIDEIIFEVPSFFSIYIYKYFRGKSVFFIIGDMVRCIKIDRKFKDIFNFKYKILFLYYFVDKLIISHLSNKEISFGGAYRGLFQGRLQDQYSLVKDNTEAHFQTFHQSDVFYKKYTLNNDLIKILTIFRLSPEKDIYNIIECSRLLKINNFNFIWNILGDGPCRDVFQKAIDDAGLSAHINLCGNIEHGNQFFEFVDDSDLYVLPNRNTGIGVGRTGWEMMARGLICVFPPLANRRHFNHGINCFITKSGSPEEYFICISNFIQNSLDAQQISNNASQTAFDNAVEPAIDHIVNHITRTIR